MSLIFASVIAIAAQAAPSVPVCDVANGTVAPETVVELTGEYLSDFMHFSELRADGCQVFVEVPLGGEDELSNAFLDATWRRRPFPRLGVDETVTIRLRGRVRFFAVPLISDAQAAGVRDIELIEVSVQGEDAGR